jgi:zinc/manganese transport system substrate-binding protein
MKTNFLPENQLSRPAVKRWIARVWSAATCRRFPRLADLPAKESRVQGLVEISPRLASSTARSRLPKTVTSHRTPYVRRAVAIGFPLFLFAFAAQAAQLNVVATLPDYAAIAHEIGGARIKVTSIARGTEDPHFVDAKPSYIRVLNQADMLLESGAELEIGWLPPLVNNARNEKILGDAPGHVILSRGIRMLEVPTGPVDRSMGDVHPLGNPHYWLDPGNGRIIAATLAEAFSKLDAANAPFYQANLQKFNERLDQKTAEWTKAMEPYKGTKVVTYHKSLTYFLERFGLEQVGTIEPKPGIEPSPSYINGLIPKLKGAGVRLVLVEPFRPRKTPTIVAQAIGAKLVLLPAAVNGHEKVKDYFSLFDYDVAQIVAALK